MEKAQKNDHCCVKMKSYLSDPTNIGSDREIIRKEPQYKIQGGRLFKSVGLSRDYKSLNWWERRWYHCVTALGLPDTVKYWQQRPESFRTSSGKKSSKMSLNTVCKNMFLLSIKQARNTTKSSHRKSETRRGSTITLSHSNHSYKNDLYEEQKEKTSTLFHSSIPQLIGLKLTLIKIRMLRV